MTALTSRLVAWLGLALAAATAEARAGPSSSFDHYLLALSWSPSYCSSPAGEEDRLQCGGGKHFAFIVHGLWPQYETGWPQFCLTSELSVPEETIAGMLSIMPSPSLIAHQWRKHGSCSGLAMGDYFELTRSLRARVRIPARYLSPNAPIVTSPAQIVSDFVKSNSKLDASMISLRCGYRKRQARLSEVHICFDPWGNFASCRNNQGSSCRVSPVVLPAVRMTHSERAH